MEVLGHFIFELIKIAVLSIAYTAIVLLIKSGLSIQKQESGFTKPKFLQAFKVIYGLLFVFSFTYYGDHGLGDEYKIPLGHRETMRAGDLSAYFTPKNQTDQIEVKAYTVSNGYLCMATVSGYITYNLSTGKAINWVPNRAIKFMQRVIGYRLRICSLIFLNNIIIIGVAGDFGRCHKEFLPAGNFQYIYMNEPGCPVVRKTGLVC